MRRVDVNVPRFNQACEFEGCFRRSRQMGSSHRPLGSPDHRYLPFGTRLTDRFTPHHIPHIAAQMRPL